MPRKKSKYYIRRDGTIELTEVIDGKRKHFYGHTDKECEDKRAAYLAALAAAPRCRTFEQVADSWWEHKQLEISPNTIHGYKAAKNRAVDAFGSMLVDELTPQLCIGFLRRLASQGYSVKVASNTKSVLHCILDEAFAAGEISSNPATDLPPLQGKPKVRRQAAAQQDVAILEQHKADCLASRMMYLMLYTGLRRGEACALQWKHVNIVTRTITVEQSLAYGTTSTPIIKAPKTEAGFRMVPLLDNVLDVLPAPGPAEQFVFFPDGLPRRRAYDEFIDDFRSAVGITSTCHQLRHSYSSLLFDAGFSPKEMQHALGHANISVTMDIYTHLQAQHTADMRSKLNAYVVENVVEK